VPIWDIIVPYSPHGDKTSAVVQQGFGLSFITIEGGNREIRSIPTTWVTYEFSEITGKSYSLAGYSLFLVQKI